MASRASELVRTGDQCRSTGALADSSMTTAMTSLLLKVTLISSSTTDGTARLPEVLRRHFARRGATGMAKWGRKVGKHAENCPILQLVRGGRALRCGERRRDDHPRVDC